MNYIKVKLYEILNHKRKIDSSYVQKIPPMILFKIKNCGKSGIQFKK